MSKPFTSRVFTFACARLSPVLHEFTHGGKKGRKRKRYAHVDKYNNNNLYDNFVHSLAVCTLRLHGETRDVQNRNVC